MREASKVDWRASAPWIGLLLTLAAIGVVELASHGPVPLRDPYPGALLVLTLVAVAWSAFTAGLRVGLLSAGLVAAYTTRFVPETFGMATRLESALILFFLGGTIAVVVGLLKARADRMAARALARERAQADALQAANGKLQEANAELRRSNETLEAFTYVVTHDLKEPVRALTIYLDVATEEYGSPDGREALDAAKKANTRFGALLNGLLDYSRATTGALDLEPVEVRGVLESDACRAQYAELLRERHGRLEVSADAPPVEATPALLAQVLGNLVVNAVKHNPRDRPLVRVVAMAGGDGRVEIRVEDDGPGFPAATLQRFARLRHDRPSTIRGGFGLLITRRAVERLGGEMRLENLPGGGARVRLALPAAAPRGGQAEAPETRASRAETRGPVGRGRPSP